jgi:hypothetical protein
MLSHHRPQVIALIIALFVALSGAVHAAGGSVTVVNHTVIPLQITDAAEKPIVQVGSARSQVIPSPPGRRTFRALRLDGSLYLEATVVVKPKGTVVWEIVPIEAVLDIRNNTTRDVTIEVDGQPLADLKAGASMRMDGIRPGARQLTARSGETRVATTVAQLTRRDTYVWNLGQPGNADAGIPVLRVRNFSGQAVKIFVNGRSRITLYPAESSALVGIAPGPVQVEARALKTGAAVAKSSLNLARGQTFVWEVAGPEGSRATLEVRNRMRHPLKVCVDGAFCLQVRPESAIQYDDLAPGRHTFQAYALETDRLVEAIDADLVAGNPYQWDVGTAE